MENIRVLIDITPEGIFYCTESKEQKHLRVNDIETETFGKESEEYWDDWYKVNDLQEIVDWLKS